MSNNNIKTLNAKQGNLALNTVLATVVWEFLSYFGMRSLLILYLTQYLHLQDDSAYTLYGSYISLVFLTPILGGWLADKVLGFKNAVILGCALIIVGHLILTSSINNSLYIGLACLIVGVGFFKSNAICMVAECAKIADKDQDAAYIHYYVAANFGGTIGPILCALVAQMYGWHWGFAVAAFGMAIGLLTLLMQYKNLSMISPAKFKIGIKHSFILTIITIVLIGGTTLILVNGIASYLLIVTLFFVIFYFFKIYKTSQETTKHQLLLVLFLTLLGMTFWIFDQQGGSSVSLFILRNVSKNIHDFIVPTAWFQSISPMVILIFGPIIAMVWRVVASKGISVSAMAKVVAGLLLLTLGFTMFSVGALISYGQVNMIWVILGLTMIGIAELFIDPVILSKLNKSAPSESKGLLTGLYFLFVGAYANYASVQVAKLSVYFSKDSTLTSSLSGYVHEFNFIIVSTLISVLLALIFFSWSGGRLWTACVISDFGKTK